MTDFQKLLKNVNRRIDRIKESGLQPVTLKTPADIIEQFVEKKGTSEEGRIKTYREYLKSRGDNPIISEAEYMTKIKDFVFNYDEQLTVYGNIRYQYESALAKMLIGNERGQITDSLMDDLSKISKRDMIELIIRAGEETNTGVIRGDYDSEQFYYLLAKYSKDYIKSGDEE